MPPERVWDGIAERIGPPPAPARDRLRARLWDSLGFWRGAGLLAAGAAAALAVYVALQPAGVGRDQIAALDQRLARIEGATQGLAATPVDVAALRDRLAGIESRLDATVPLPSHVAVLIDRYSRPMMTADLDLADSKLALRLHITPPRDFTGKTLEVWLEPTDGTPRSLGLFPSERSGTATVLILPPEIAEALATAAARRQPRAIRRLDHRGADGPGPVLGRARSRSISEPGLAASASSGRSSPAPTAPRAQDLIRQLAAPVVAWRWETTGGRGRPPVVPPVRIRSRCLAAA